MQDTRGFLDTKSLKQLLMFMLAVLVLVLLGLLFLSITSGNSTPPPPPDQCEYMVYLLENVYGRGLGGSITVPLPDIDADDALQATVDYLTDHCGWEKTTQNRANHYYPPDIE